MNIKVPTDILMPCDRYYSVPQTLTFVMLSLKGFACKLGDVWRRQFFVNHSQVLKKMFLISCFTERSRQGLVRAEFLECSGNKVSVFPCSQNVDIEELLFLPKRETAGKKKVKLSTKLGTGATVAVLAY